MQRAAKLMLCGETIQGFINDPTISNKKLPLQDSPVTREALFAILDDIEKGEHDASIDQAGYVKACEYLGFSQLPEIAFGAAEWAKYFGFIVNDAPPSTQPPSASP